MYSNCKEKKNPWSKVHCVPEKKIGCGKQADYSTTFHKNAVLYII